MVPNQDYTLSETYTDIDECTGNKLMYTVSIAQNHRIYLQVSDLLNYDKLMNIFFN